MVPPVSLSHTVSPPFFLPYGEGGICLGPILSHSPLGDPVPAYPLVVRAALFPSLAPYALSVIPSLSDACVVGSGAQCWRTAPDIGMSFRCSWTCGTRITRSCLSKFARICSRRQQKDTHVDLEAWCEPLAQSPPPSPLSIPRSWLVFSSVLKGNF